MGDWTLPSEEEYRESGVVMKTHGVTTGRWRSDGRKSHTVYPIKYLVVTGDLTTGFIFHGLFDSHDHAERWATTNLGAGTFYKVHNMSDVGDRV